jgi:ABC-2 type transport system permease protein
VSASGSPIVPPAVVHSIRVIARKDFTAAIRSRTLLALGAVFVLFIGGTAGLVSYLGEGVAAGGLFGASAGGLLGLRLSYAGILGLIVGLTALLAAYGAIVDERSTGTLKLLLGLPHPRRSVVLGKLLGRTTVVVTPTLVGFLVAAVAILAGGGSVDFLRFTVLVLLTMLLCAVFVATAVGISAAARSQRRATVTALGGYVFFALFWAPFAQGVDQVVALVFRELPGLSAPSPLASLKLSLFVKILNPLRAYESLAISLYGTELQGRLALAGFRERALGQSLGELPLYLGDPALLVVLLAWVIVPIAYGVARFDRVEL